MAGIVNDFTGSPRYQRMIQKMAALRPEQRAIVDTAMLDSAFADDAMKRHMRGMSVAADAINKDRTLANKEKSLDLQKQSLGLRTSLGKDKLDLYKKNMDWGEKQADLGTYIEAASLPVAGYFGYKQMQADQDEAEQTRKFRDKLLL